MKCSICFGAGSGGVLPPVDDGKYLSGRSLRSLGRTAEYPPSGSKRRELIVCSNSEEMMWATLSPITTSKMIKARKGTLNKVA